MRILQINVFYRHNEGSICFNSTPLHKIKYIHIIKNSHGSQGSQGSQGKIIKYKVK